TAQRQPHGRQSSHHSPRRPFHRQPTAGRVRDLPLRDSPAPSMSEASHMIVGQLPEQNTPMFFRSSPVYILRTVPKLPPVSCCSPRGVCLRMKRGLHEGGCAEGLATAPSFLSAAASFRPLHAEPGQPPRTSATASAVLP